MAQKQGLIEIVGAGGGFYESLLLVHKLHKLHLLFLDIYCQGEL